MEDEEFASIIASINPKRLEEPALTTRRQLFDGLPPDVFCVASTRPRAGSYNIVYKLSFSDGVKWAIRIPAKDDVHKPSRIRSLYLDIITQRFTSSKTSIPIPQIHYWSLDSSNILSRPFVIMDFIPGTNLSKLWNDRSWITDQKREKIFEQIAGWMTELSALEFDQIGCLDWDEASGTHRIVPFPDSSAFLVRLWQGSEEPDSTAVPAGPFNAAHEYLSFILSLRRRISDSSILAILQLFLSALPDSTLDGPPFALCPPDFDSQNVLVDNDGIITGIIDWDGVRTLPRQGGAAAYPAWLTVDWVPICYGWKKDASPEDNMRHDSPTELASYRRAYLGAITRASGGKLTHVARNSHIWTTMHNAICSEITASEIVLELSKFVFGSSVFDVEQGIRGSAWFALRNAPEAIAGKIYHAGDTNGEGDSDGTNEGSAVDSDGTGGARNSPKIRLDA
ncbi:hypothetical protein F5887DRAFT_908515 [Amanita rubescens]|nr:hypothetical protein F5887DRAFT_908515 [Amanita rubescens]